MYLLTDFPPPETPIPCRERAFKPEIDCHRRGFTEPRAIKPLQGSASGDAEYASVQRDWCQYLILLFTQGSYCDTLVYMMSSSSKLDASCYLEALKELLKERGVTYARLADAVHCSLPTVKRALNKPTLPFSRLLEFCEIAQIPFGDLYERAEQRRPRHYVFTKEQDQLFAEREELFAYFLELAREKSTPSDIAKRHDLDQRSTALYLQHLARVGLVERQERNRVKLCVPPPFGFGPNSRVMRREHEKFLKTIVANVLAEDSEKKGCVVVLKPLHLTEEDYKQMVTEMENVIHRYAAIAERGLSKGSTSLWQVALASGPGPEARPRHLPRIGT